MILKKHNLKLRKEKDFFIKAKRHYSPLFTAFYQKYIGEFLTTVVVPKKRASKSSLRIKVKRKIAVALNEIIKQSEEAINLKLVLVAKERLVAGVESNQLKPSAIKDEIKTLLEKIS
jgi:hypothetical protein